MHKVLRSFMTLRNSFDFWITYYQIKVLHLNLNIALNVTLKLTLGIGSNQLQCSMMKQARAVKKRCCPIIAFKNFKVGFWQHWFLTFCTCLLYLCTLLTINHRGRYIRLDWNLHSQFKKHRFNSNFQCSSFIFEFCF